MKLIGLLVLLGLVSLVEGEVVESFADSCPEFFIKDKDNKPVISSGGGCPSSLAFGFFDNTGVQDNNKGKGEDKNNNNNLISATVLQSKKRYRNQKPRYRQICQRFGNKYRYATLYDTQNRIPVYSAYLFANYTATSNSKNTWMVEPQLDAPNSGSGMAAGSPTSGGQHQALPTDYENSGYEIGLLSPRCLTCAQDQAQSALTLTNAVPQDAQDSRDWRGQVESAMASIINTECQKGTAHVVTGVVPGEAWIVYGAKNRVNVPSYLWSAFCCKRRGTDEYLSHGYLAKTRTGPGRSSDVKTGTGESSGRFSKMAAERMSVGQLNLRLSRLYSPYLFRIKKIPFGVFGGVCV